jgi:hypothetical protein
MQSSPRVKLQFYFWKWYCYSLSAAHTKFSETNGPLNVDEAQSSRAPPLHKVELIEHSFDCPTFTVLAVSLDSM